MGWPYHYQQTWNKYVLRFRNQVNAAHTTKFLLWHVIKPSYKSD